MSANLAQSRTELREAATDLGAAQQIVGLDRWATFLTDADQRASDLATIAAVEESEQPPDPGKDRVTPVYPLETLVGIGAAAVTGGVAAGLRAAGRAVLRQAEPARPAVDTPENLLQSGGKPIGHPDSEDAIRELPGRLADWRTGRLADARDLFERLSKGGTDMTPPGHPWKLMKMPDGSYFGYRPTSKNGPPSIDVNVPANGIEKLKFPGN